MNLQQAEQLWISSNKEAIGYLQLAKITRENGNNETEIVNMATNALHKFVSNDEAFNHLFRNNYVFEESLLITKYLDDMSDEDFDLYKEYFGEMSCNVK